MPSPFPGMDPYLEDPTLWPGFHQGFIAALRAVLNAVMPAHYFADIGERVYVLESDRDLFPDVGVFDRPGPNPASIASAVGEPALEVEDEPLQVRETFVEIRTVRPGSRLVAVLEVLSPLNKYAGAGRTLYLDKQREVLSSPAHLLEIDLLRRGPHTVAAPEYRVRAHTDYDYLICLHRAGLVRRFATWPFRLRRPLPRIGVPLGTPDGDVALDLQAVMNRSYDDGRYERALDYSAEPPDPLAPADATWADVLLRERGLRPTA